MRWKNTCGTAADIACAPVSARKILERAQVWTCSRGLPELHGRLRRSPRIAARMAILVRCHDADHPWGRKKPETELLSRHGFQFTCRVTIFLPMTSLPACGSIAAPVETRVAWTRRKESGEISAGMEFLTEENFCRSKSATLNRPSENSDPSSSRTVSCSCALNSWGPHT